MTPKLPNNLPQDRLAQIRFRQTKDGEPARMYFEDTGKDYIPPEEDEEPEEDKE